MWSKIKRNRTRADSGGRHKGGCPGPLCRGVFTFDYRRGISPQNEASELFEDGKAKPERPKHAA